MRIMQRLRLPPVGYANDADAVARAIAYAIEQPMDVDVNEIIIRPTHQI
jgi:NADP-dependent 3-hydroxy acid dehydrogenase YdfG